MQEAESTFKAAEEAWRDKLEINAPGEKLGYKRSLILPGPASDPRACERTKARYRRSPVLTAEMAFLLGDKKDDGNIH